MTTTNPPSPEIAAYMERLARGLKPLPPDEREDVLREIGAHLEDGLAAGQDAKVLIARMGPAEEVASALIRERLVTVDARRTPAALAWIVVKAAAVPFLVAFVVMCTFMMLNTFYLYAELLGSSRVGWGTMAFLQLYNLPAIVVITVPVAALMVGLAGLPKLATAVSAPTLRSLYPRLVAATLLVGLAASVADFALNDRVVPAANRKTVDLVHTFMLNEKTPVAEADRSPQEQTLAELDRRLASMRRERDAQTAANAPYRDIEALSLSLRRYETDRHLKMAIPAYTLVLMTLGLALGTALARRRPVHVLIHVAIALAATAGVYIFMSVGRASIYLHDAPVAAAWVPLLFPAMAAAIVWAYAKITRQGVYADV